MIMVEKIPLDLIQLRLRVLGQHLEVVAENHDGEDAASSEQHGDVAVEGVAEGQHDDVWFKLGKYFNISFLTFFLTVPRSCRRSVSESYRSSSSYWPI